MASRDLAIPPLLTPFLVFGGTTPVIATISIPHLRQLHFQTSGGYSSCDCCVPSHTFVHLNSGNLNSGSLNSDNNYIVPFLTTMFDVLLFRNLSVPHPCMNELLFFLKLQKLNQRRIGPCLAVCLITSATNFG